MEDLAEFSDEPTHEVDAKLHKRVEDRRIAELSPQDCAYLKELLE